MSKDDRITALEKRVDDLEKKVAKATIVDQSKIKEAVRDEISRSFSDLQSSFDGTPQY